MDLQDIGVTSFVLVSYLSVYMLWNEQMVRFMWKIERCEEIQLYAVLMGKLQNLLQLDLEKGVSWDFA